jgi:hypothetical protein
VEEILLFLAERYAEFSQELEQRRRLAADRLGARDDRSA